MVNKNTSPRSTLKNALVVEGGAMRGIFSAGVLDTFLLEGFDPFDLYIGVSAGAGNIADASVRYRDITLRPGVKTNEGEVKEKREDVQEQGEKDSDQQENGDQHHGVADVACTHLSLSASFPSSCSGAIY